MKLKFIFFSREYGKLYSFELVGTNYISKYFEEHIHFKNQTPNKGCPRSGRDDESLAKKLFVIGGSKYRQLFRNYSHNASINPRNLWKFFLWLIVLCIFPQIFFSKNRSFFILMGGLDFSETCKLPKMELFAKIAAKNR